MTTEHLTPQSERQDQETEGRTTVFDKEAKQNKRRRGIRLIAATAAASVAIGGGIAGAYVAGRGNNVEAKAPPVATAPANPVEQPSAAAPTETQPGTTEIDVANLSLGNFPFKTADGETLEGLEEFKEKNQLLVSKYGVPDISGVVEGNKRPVSKLIEDFNRQRTAAVNAGVDQMTSPAYKNYKMTYLDDVFNSEEVATGEDAVRKTYDDAFNKTFIKGDSSDLSASIAEYHKNVAGFKKTDPSYGGEYDSSGMERSAPTWVPSTEGITFTDMKTTFTDTNGKSYSAKESIHFGMDYDEEGRRVYVITQSEVEYLPSTAS